MNSSHAFYESVPVFERFGEVADAKHYRPVPEDWVVVVTDVIGSTRAIAENRYKEVNMLGASSIVAVLNALDKKKVPFVFGGDGATILLHRDDLEKVRPALIGTQRLAKSSFGLEIRTGAVPVAELLKVGATVEVAKFRVAKCAVLAMIKGGGLPLAERWIKGDERYRISDDSAGEHGETSFEGLSCRWNPVPAKRGEMISLLVAATVPAVDHSRIYSEVLDGIEAILHDDLGSHPVTDEKLFAGKKKWKLKNLAAEIRLRGNSRSILGSPMIALKVLGSAAFVFGTLALGMKIKRWDPAKYVADLAASSDFRKFDDMLRMIRDCDSSQRKALEKFLEEKRAEGKIAYGLHVSHQALMTCLVFNLDDHVHFIDGDGGGYAMAAKQLKEQLSFAFVRTDVATA